jgi:hypothetical protein
MTKAARRDISGWVVLDKPVGMTSTQAVGKVRWLLGAKKAGHAGTLDPLASGRPAWLAHARAMATGAPAPVSSTLLPCATAAACPASSRSSEMPASPAATGSTNAFRSAAASSASSPTAIASPKGPTAVRRSIATCPRVPSARARSRASARTYVPLPQTTSSSLCTGPCVSSRSDSTSTWRGASSTSSPARARS